MGDRLRFTKWPAGGRAEKARAKKEADAAGEPEAERGFEKEALAGRSVSDALKLMREKGASPAPRSRPKRPERTCRRGERSIFCLVRGGGGALRCGKDRFGERDALGLRAACAGLIFANS